MPSLTSSCFVRCVASSNHWIFNKLLIHTGKFVSHTLKFYTTILAYNSPRQSQKNFLTKPVIINSAVLFKTCSWAPFDILFISKCLGFTQRPWLDISQTGVQNIPEVGFNKWAGTMLKFFSITCFLVRLLIQHNLS